MVGQKAIADDDHICSRALAVPLLLGFHKIKICFVLNCADYQRKLVSKCIFFAIIFMRLSNALIKDG